MDGEKTIAIILHGDTKRYACYLDGSPLLLQYKTLDDLVNHNPEYAEVAVEFFKKEVKKEAVNLAIAIDEIINDPDLFFFTLPYGQSLEDTLEMLLENDTAGIKEDLDSLILLAEVPLHKHAEALRLALESFEVLYSDYDDFKRKYKNKGGQLWEKNGS